MPHSINPILSDVTEKIIARSQQSRASYLDTVNSHRATGPVRETLSPGNQAHAYAVSVGGSWMIGKNNEIVL